MERDLLKPLIENGSEDTFELSRKETRSDRDVYTDRNGDILVVEYITYIYSL